MLETLRHLASRRNWLYMKCGDKDTDRLHFHALVYISKGEMVGNFEEVTDYNKKTGRQKRFMQNTFFEERFGRNEFNDVSFSDRVYGKAIGFVMKYMEKQKVKVVYSRGLFKYFCTDIDGKDVAVNEAMFDETKNKLILHDNFMCWYEGVQMGEVSRETIAQLPKAK